MTPIHPKKSPLTLGGISFSSRLILGTGKFSNTQTMIEAIEASGTELVTVALRRFNREKADDDLCAPLAQLKNVTLMPNTSGALNAQEAIRAAQIGRELSGSAFVKVEIHPNPHHLMPDPIETYLAAKELAADGFIVLPYIPADPVLAKKLEDVGCAAVMPLGSAIGSGGGLSTADMIQLIVRDSTIPVIVDAGLRAPWKWDAMPFWLTPRSPPRNIPPEWPRPLRSAWRRALPPAKPASCRNRESPSPPAP
jgi:thiazole synthase